MPKNLEYHLAERELIRFEEIFNSHILPEDIQKLGIDRLKNYSQYIVAIVDSHDSKPHYWSYLRLKIYKDLEYEMSTV